MYHWSDFCVYTTKGNAVEKISLDIEWCNINIPDLKNDFDTRMLPESFSKTETMYYLFIIYNYCITCMKNHINIQVILWKVILTCMKSNINRHVILTFKITYKH